MIKINEKNLDITKFPNNETLVETKYVNELIKNEELIRIDFKWHNDEDLINLYFIMSHLKEHFNGSKHLYIYYMPYSRMDRNENGNCFTLHHICDLIKTTLKKEDKIHIVEPHSDVTLNELNAERINLMTPLVQEVLSKHSDIDVICYPDKGAKARFKDDTIDKPVIYCEKVRDFDTGEIKGLTLVGDVSLQDKNVLIVDDLCSKGGTFYHTAKELQKNGAKNIYLTVCHMESTIRYGKILNNCNLIKHIYTTDSMLYPVEAYWLQKENSITIYDLDNYLHNNILEVQNNMI